MLTSPTPAHLAIARDAGTAVATVAIAFTGTGAPEWVHLLPAGRFNGAPVEGKGPWHVGDPTRLIADSLTAREGTRDLVIDYDHQTDFGAKPGVGGTARAAGWIKALEARDDGIWGRVEWTEAGAAAIAAREYRFLSPVFTYTAGGQVLRLLRAALTNNPALELTAISSKGNDASMNELLQKLRELLKLEDEADADAICAALETLTAASAGLAAIAQAAGLDAEASGEDIAAAVAAAVAKADAAGQADPDPAKFVPIDQYNALAARVGALESDSTEEKAVAAVDQAVKDGKIVPAQRDWALAYARKDLAGFQGFAAKQPAIVKPGTALPALKDPKDDNGLDAEDRALCRQLGIAEAAFLETRKAEREEKAA